MHLFRNPGIAKVLAVERDVKPRNMNFAKLQGGINREGAFIRINMVVPFPLHHYLYIPISLCQQ